jgi:hypothetical protein
MYRALIDNKKYYLAVNKFPKTAKKTTLRDKPYNTGFRHWKADDCETYAIVIGTFRIMFGIKVQGYGDCPS